MILKGTSGNTYALDSVPIGSGGEGDIYTLQGAATQVAKIYKAGAMTKSLEEKLKVMVANPPNTAVFTQVAWPLDVLYNDGGQCVGFVMPRLNITHELGEIYKYPSMLPLTSFQKVNIAQNICVVIYELHKAGYVFGDFNPRNIGLDIGTGLVSFLDTDTYHVYDKSSSVTHRCNVCAPGYAAPELLEKCERHVAENPSDSRNAYAKTPLPTFTQETDNFSLAIHVFKLLMNGYTPFGGIIETAAVSQSSPGVGDAAVRRDSYCFKPGFKHQSSAIMPLEAFPQEVGELFTRAFIVGKDNPARRPRAEEWHAALVMLGQSMVACHYEPRHFYYRENKSCPLCEADARFAEAIRGGSNTRSAAPVLAQTAYANPYQAQSAPTRYDEYANPVYTQQKSKRTTGIVAAILGSAAVIVLLLIFVLPGVIAPPSPEPPPTLIADRPAPPPETAEETPTPTPTPDANEAEPSPATEEPVAVASPTPSPPPPSPTPPALPRIDRVGDTVQLGGHNWRILTIQGNQAFLVTDRIITSRTYHPWDTAVTWENSDIRHWLNNDFFADFSPQEQAIIIETNLVNSNNPTFGTSGGSNTWDRVFLMSIDEVISHFGDAGQGRSTARSTSDIWGQETTWWLRTPGNTARHVLWVSGYGHIALSGNPATSSIGVRPAMWVSTN